MSSPDEIDLAALHALLERGGEQDRAYVDALVRMAWSRTNDPAKRAALSALHRAIGDASLRSHAAVRERIAAGTFRGAALREHFDAVPALERDHVVEEVLGIAYPPLDEPRLGPELTPYTPSGYDEIVHAFDVTSLERGDRFLDIGSGTAKAVLLATLLCGAQGSGIECTGSLHDLAQEAAAALGVDARLSHGDARDAAFEDADVVFMYLPFTGSVLAAVMDRLLASGRDATRSRQRFLCAGSLDLRRYEDLVAAGPPRSWLHVYAWR